MTELDLAAVGRFLRKNGAVLLILVLGVALMLLPSGGSTGGSAGRADFSGEEEKLAQVVSRIEGAGECSVLFREETAEEKGGAVIVCPGADSASVRLRITEAVGTYTGLGSDRITILKSEKGGN